MAETMIDTGTDCSSITPDSHFAEKLRGSIGRLIRWVETNDYRAYDPGDGNNSFLNFLTFDNLLLERILQQAVYRAPLNLRPLLGIRPHRSTKGMGYMAWGYLKMFRLTGETSYQERARYCLDWLMRNRSNTEEFCWGNNFSFSTRAGKIPKGAPTIVWSGLIGQAFFEAWQTLGDDRFLEVAASTCRWILSLPREKSSSGDCLSYVAFKQSSIHNSNMLGAALLASVGSQTKNEEMVQTARQAMRYSCCRQRPDGSWFYGEDAKYHWIDNFHTGYNLDSLHRYMDATGDRQFEEQLTRGFAFFENTFFEADGCPKYYHNQKYPIDIQCAAQAIDTLTFFSDSSDTSLDLAEKVAAWTLDHMQAPDGHFYYRDLGWAVNKTPMLHWGQGTMFKALAHLLTRLSPATKGKGIAENAERPEDAQAIGRAKELKYVLITAAQNEEAFIENTIRSVIAQTKLPEKWIIVSDGSADRTDEIVRRYTQQHNWIVLRQRAERSERNFAAKAECVNDAFRELQSLDFEVVGNLDADVSFGPDYFEFVLDRFAAAPNLGVAGTPYFEGEEGKRSLNHDFANLNHVSGPCQLFRRGCFESVGGYARIKGGAIDWVAVTTARMKGWQTQSFIGRTYRHHRTMGTAESGKLKSRFHYGRKAYYVGGHPVWEILRGIFQMKDRPRVVGGLYFIAGYIWAAASRVERPISGELMKFHRAEQMRRLRRTLERMLRLKNSLTRNSQIPGSVCLLDDKIAK